jgi:hypothetical protein
MKNTLPGSPPSTAVIIRVENAEEYSTEPLTEEVILYDECGDTQWDKVLAQHDLADQLGEDTRNK